MRRWLVALGIAILAACPGARAQGSTRGRPVRIVLPVPPGGATERIARPVRAEAARWRGALGADRIERITG